MCYHISFEVKLESVLDLFPELVVDPNLRLEFPTAAYVNGFDHPMQHVIVRSRKDEQLHLAPMMWGFLPPWVNNREGAEKFWNGYKDENGKWNTGFTTLNAVGEEMLQKKMYRDSALQRRCVVVIDGFYEWHHHFPMGKKGVPLKTAVKYPHHIRLKKEGDAVIMLAGIWTAWKHQEVDESTGEVSTRTTPTFAIVTTAANPLMEKIHNSKKRMPVILTKELADEWLKPGLEEERIDAIARFSYPAAEMKAYAVEQDFQRNSDPKRKTAYEVLGEDFC